MLGVRLDPGPTRGSLALLVCVAAAALGCDGGTIAVPCSDERCSAQCVASGDESGTCNAADEELEAELCGLVDGHSCGDAEHTLDDQLARDLGLER
ncbi:MAG: hypothetical protein ACK5U8_28735 [Deltaproteobacteria bacterium]